MKLPPNVVALTTADVRRWTLQHRQGLLRDAFMQTGEGMKLTPKQREAARVARTEVISTTITQDDCVTCGACCLARGHVNVVALTTADVYRRWTPLQRRTLLRDAPMQTVVPAKALRVIQSEGDRFPRCAALQGEVGKNATCRVYENRPTVCREFTPGSAACVHARAQLGL